MNEKTMADKEKLKEIRDRIDNLDQEIQILINERAACAQEIAKVKEQAGEGKNHVYRPEREADVQKRIIKRNQGPLSNEEMVRLFKEIMSSCRALEEPMTVAFLGPEGTFTQEAAYKQFGHAISTTPLGAIDEVFRDVESGAANYGVVPIENSTEGVISHTLDMFINSSLKVCGEVDLRVHHCLLGKATDISGVKKVYAHQQALAQCREWLDANLAGIERIAVSSNAEAARIVAGEKKSAAIASEAAAEIYDINVIVTNIEDEPDNTTRFLVIGKQMPEPSGNDKTSLLLSMPNKPGALYEVLSPLANHGVSMTRIESRPSRRGMWDYVYFIDFEGHAKEEKVRTALKELAGKTSMLKILGSYPKAVL